MKLRFSLTSPYVRKVRIVAYETGLAERIELVPANPWVVDTDVPADNPLGKVPALITDAGEHLYDSPVICEYLDSLHQGAKLFPASGPARWKALRRQALGDGLLDAALVVRLETTMRPAERRWPDWIERHQAAISRSLATLEAEAADLHGLSTIGEVTAACALGYLDFRFPAEDWRRGHPRLAEWYEGQQKRVSVSLTAPHD